MRPHPPTSKQYATLLSRRARGRGLVADMKEATKRCGQSSGVVLRAFGMNIEIDAATDLIGH